MTDQERAAALADEIERKNGLCWGVIHGQRLDGCDHTLIVNALRRLAEQAAPSPAAGDLREVVEAAMKAKRAELIASPLQRIWPDLTDAALSAISAAGYVILPREPTRKYSIDDRVTKTKGSSWTGRVVGFCSTNLTPIGYAVESENEPGSVQIYPEVVLAAKEPAQ